MISANIHQSPHKKKKLADDVDDLALLANTPNLGESLLHSRVSENKREFTCFKLGVISLVGKSLKLAHHFTYLGSNITSTESNVNINPRKVRASIEKLTIISKSNLFDKIKRDFFLFVAMANALRKKNSIGTSQERFELFWKYSVRYTQKKTATVQPLTSDLTNH